MLNLKNVFPTGRHVYLQIYYGLLTLQKVLFPFLPFSPISGCRGCSGGEGTVLSCQNYISIRGWRCPIDVILETIMWRMFWGHCLNSFDLIVWKCCWFHCSMVEKILPRSIDWKSLLHSSRHCQNSTRVIQPILFSIVWHGIWHPLQAQISWLSCPLYAPGYAGHCTGISNHRGPVLTHAFWGWTTNSMILPVAEIWNPVAYFGIPPRNINIYYDPKSDSCMCQPIQGLLRSTTSISLNTHRWLKLPCQFHPQPHISCKAMMLMLSPT